MWRLADMGFTFGTCIGQWLALVILCVHMYVCMHLGMYALSVYMTTGRNTFHHQNLSRPVAHIGVSVCA
jgi:hypothetical protein